MNEHNQSTQFDTAHNQETGYDDGMYTIRRATTADMPFLAWMQYEASLPPSNFSFWDYPLMGFGIDTRAFIETVLRTDAGTWGRVADFRILEKLGKPIAAAAGIEVDAEFSRGPVRISSIEAIGKELRWSAAQTEMFKERYTASWPNPQGNPLLLPQAPYIIESVAVVPDERGKGVIQRLMSVLLDEGRERGHTSVGITIANGNHRAQRAYERLGFQMYLAFGPAYFGDPSFSGYTKYKRAL
jgi:GNAT superfamily N-acetyltransferase